MYNLKIESVLKKLETNDVSGLNQSQVDSLLSKYGENKLRDKKKKTNIQRFFEQFKDVMIIILLVAAAVSFGIACYHGDASEFFEPALILFIVILNAIIGVAQESKAEKSLEALQSLSAPHARVIREGKEQVIDAVGIVPGDIIKLEAGDFIPADARLIKSASLKCEESALTGESVPAEKDYNDVVAENAPLGDRVNMIFSGCSVTYGTATAVVTSTGMNTEIGKIANLLEGEENTQTPLQAKLANLGKYLGILAIIACAIIFVVGIIDGMPVMEIFMTSVSLAVSAIPEGLPAIVTVVLSIGVQRMVKKNAIIRRLPAVETLGSASVICSDKTGTLTQNRMTLVKGYFHGNNNVEDITDNCSNDIKELLKLGTLCCDGSVVVENGETKLIGDPTETAIVMAALNNKMTKQELNEKFPRKGEIPFDSDRKLMTTINLINDKNVVIVKGAYDVIESKCKTEDMSKVRQICDEMSSQALRVLAVAYKVIDRVPDKMNPEELENDLNFVGLVGMIDPPRPEAKEAVKICRLAGIKPVMITGDHVVTASAIAKELGIMSEGDKAITGTQLLQMKDEELKNNIEHISVYARVSPEDKIRIVKAWQSKDAIVSMTGDGVNDAPALKAADIGCAMGITGTDVAKGAADMTLTDDNFATIVDAVREGRGIYSNIRKVVGFLLGTNIGEVLTVFFAMILWKKTPLLSMHLLWINLVTDSMPAIALGMEAVEEDVMNHPPKPKNEGIFAHGYGVRIFLQGCMFAILTLLAFYIGIKDSGEVQVGQTMAFFVLSLSQVIQAYNMRSEHSLFKIGVFTNSKLNFATAISIILIVLVLFTPLSIVFELKMLSANLYFIGFLLSIVPIFVMEFSKFFGLIKNKR